MDWTYEFLFLMCTSQVLSQHIPSRQPKWRTNRNVHLSKAIGRSMYNLSSKKGIDMDWIHFPESSHSRFVEPTKGAIVKRPSRLTTRRTKKRRTTAKTMKRTTRKWTTLKWNLTRPSKTIYTTIDRDDKMSRRPKPTSTPTDGGAAPWFWKKYFEGFKADKYKTETGKFAPKKLKGSLVPEPQEEDSVQYIEESSDEDIQLQNTEENYMMLQDREDLPLHEKYDRAKQQQVFNVRDQGSRRQHIQLQWQRGIVPYEIDTEIYDDLIIKRILHAMKVIESASCVTFQNIDDQKYRTRRLVFRLPYLRITNPEKKRDCVHRIDFGKRAEAVLVLGFDCMQTRDIIHSLLHALGFMDEITHPQRDAYVRVLWENIQPKYRYLFALQNVTLPYKTLVEYDTMSIMHFHDRAYSINGGATIAPLVPGLLIQPSKSLSQLDKMKLRLAFGQECNKRKVEDLVETCKFALGDSGQNPAQGDEENFDQNTPEHSQDFTVIEPLSHSTENAIDNSLDYHQLVASNNGQGDYQQNAIDNGLDSDQQSAPINEQDDDQQNAIDINSDYDKQGAPINDEDDDQQTAIDNNSDYDQQGAPINDEDDDQQNAIDNGSDYHQQNALEDGKDANHYSDREKRQVHNQENVFDNGQSDKYKRNGNRKFSYTKW